MAQILSDDPKVTAILKELVAVIRGNNGYFHPGMRIVCEKGQLGIHALNREMQGQWLMKIPDPCLVPVDAFEWGLSGDAIVIKKVSGTVAPLQEKVAGLVVDLFNATGKMKQYGAYSLLLRGKNYPELVEMLFKARPGRENTKNEILNYHGDEDFYVRSYLYTRTGESKSGDILMPVLDLLNHHVDGAFIDRYSGQEDASGMNDADSEGGLGVRCRCPVNGSDECFASYGFFKDAHDIFLSYHYIDESISVLRSVPVDIDFGETGALRVLSHIVAPGYKDSRQLPPGIADLWFFMPPVNMNAQPRKTMTLGYLFVPGPNAPFALRRVLALAVRELDRSLPQARLDEFVLAAENAILDRNLEYYTELREFLQNSVPAPEDAYFFSMAARLAETQIGRINQYRLFHDL